MDHEKRVRDTAAAFAEAVRAARKAGYSVSWPSNPDSADRISISETGAGKIVTQVVAPGLDPVVVDKANRAGQAAVDKVIAKANDGQVTKASDKA